MTQPSRDDLPCLDYHRRPGYRPYRYRDYYTDVFNLSDGKLSISRPVLEVMKMIKKWLSSIWRGRNESGVSLVEALVAVAILGGGVLTMILAMSGGVLAVNENDEEVTAQSLARTQMEYIKNYAYDP